MSTSEGRFSSGSAIRQYRLTEKLVEDQLGTIWRAQDSALARIVTLRMLRGEFLWDAQRSETLIIEAKGAAGLNHPSICRLFGLEQWNEELFLASENAEGRQLPQVIADSPAERDRFLHLATQLASALATAHEAKVIHGNLHGNLLFVSGDHLKVAGWGTGKTSGMSELVESELESFSYVYYLSPERVLGKPLHAYSDVFSLGIILYQLATARLPFVGTATTEVCDRILSKAPPRPQAHNFAIDSGIVSVIGRCLQKDPTRRFPNASEAYDALRALSATARREIIPIAEAAMATVPLPSTPPQAPTQAISDAPEAEPDTATESASRPLAEELASSSEGVEPPIHTAAESTMEPEEADALSPERSTPLSISDDVPPDSLFFGGEAPVDFPLRSSLTLEDDPSGSAYDPASEPMLHPVPDVQLSLEEDESEKLASPEISPLRPGEKSTPSQIKAPPVSIRSVAEELGLESSVTAEELGIDSDRGQANYQVNDEAVSSDVSDYSFRDSAEFESLYGGNASTGLDELDGGSESATSQSQSATSTPFFSESYGESPQESPPPLRDDLGDHSGLTNSQIEEIEQSYSKDYPAMPPIGESFLGSSPATKQPSSMFDEPILRTDEEAEAALDEHSAVVMLASVEQTMVSKSDASSIDRAAGAMQQILGEAVYLFDGKVIDPFGPRMIAEFSDARQAILSANKGQRDLHEYNQRQLGRGVTVEAKIVLTTGRVYAEGGSLDGPAVELAMQAAKEATPLQPVVASDVLRAAGLPASGARHLRIGDTDFFDLPAEESLREEVKVVEEESAPAEVVPEKSIPLWAIVAAAVAVLVVATLIGSFLAIRSNRKKAARLEEQRRATAQSTVQPLALAHGPREVLLEPFTVEVGDAAPAPPPQSATTARLVTLGMLQQLDGFRVVPNSRDAVRFGGRIRMSAANAELIPVQNLDGRLLEGPAIPLADPVAATNAYQSWVSGQLKVPPPALSQNAAALRSFADAVAELQNESVVIPPRALTAIRSATKADPNFRPAHLLAMDLFSRAGDRKAATEAAAAAFNLKPDDLAVRIKLAQWKLQSGAMAEGLGHYKQILASRPSDVDALNIIGLNALGVGDEARFNAAMDKLKELPNATVLHEPDLHLARGQIDTATTQLFDLESESPNNPALALKIGRFAVLRHMSGMADIELQKLQRISPDYRYELLNAYVLAEKGQSADAIAALKRAQALAPWNEQPYTSSAEVYAMLGDSSGVMESLEMAVARGEPTGNYILNNPLFRYLKNDARFRRIQTAIEAKQAEVRSALTNIRL